jgi:hypothetical protein
VSPTQGTAPTPALILSVGRGGCLTWDELSWQCYSGRGWWWVECWPQGRRGGSVTSGLHRDVWDALAEAAARMGVNNG